jgi:glycosyltransferase involved in cell wall biosynthesis
VSWLFTNIWLRFLGSHDKIVVLSRAVLDNYYRHLLPENKLICIYNGIDESEPEALKEEDIKTIQNIKSKYKIIGANAVLTKVKGLRQIVSALPLLPGYAFAALGDGNEKQNLTRLARRLGVADRCYFMGFRKNAVSWLPYYDVYAMPSYSEGFPLALLEAALAKKSCICSDIPIFREIFAENEAAFFRLDDKQSLKAAIEEAYQKRTEKGGSAYKRAAQIYTSRIMGNRYLELYTSLTNNKGDVL